MCHASLLLVVPWIWQRFKPLELEGGCGWSIPCVVAVPPGFHSQKLEFIMEQDPESYT